MKKKSMLLLLTAILLIGGIEKAVGQTKGYNKALTQDQIQEDVGILVKTLQSNHPGLYDYQTEDDFAQVVKTLEAEAKMAETILDEYKVVSRLVSSVSDAHTYAMNPCYSDILRNELLFPIIPTINNNQMEIDGKRVQSINGHTEEDILQHLQSFGNSDGNAIPYKNAFIEMEFPIKYFTFLDASASFEIVFEDGETKRLEGKSYFAEGLRKKSEKSFKIEKNTATLKIPSWEDATASSFNNDLSEMAEKSELGAFISESLAKAIEAKVGHLVVDLRGNTGGKSGPAAILLSHLINRLFKYYKEIKVVSDKFPTKEYVTNKDVVAMYESEQAKSLIEEIDGAFYFKDFVLPEIAPNPKQFLGTVDLLVDKYSLSVSTDVVAILQKNREVNIKGEEMGGSLEHYCAGTYIYLQLPNSGIEISVPLQRLKY